MTIFLVAWRLARARMSANWRLLSSVALGVVIAVVLLASAPLYSDVLNDLGLRYTLRREPPTRSDIVVQLSGRPSVSADFNAATAVVNREVGEALGQFVGSSTRLVHSASYFVYRSNERISATGQTPNNQPRGYVQFADGIERHLRIVAGRWPADSGDGISAIAGREAATDLGLAVGDTILLSPVPGGDPTRIRIAAIAEASDPTERFWSLGAVRVVERARDWTIVPMFVAEDGYFAATARVSSDYTWAWSTDTTKLTTENAPKARSALAGLRVSLSGRVQGATVVTALDAILGDYLGKLSLTVIPLYLLILQIVGLVLFYLVMISNALVDRQAGEIALLKSRGANGSQIFATFFLEGGLICLLAIAIGPPLAALLTEALVNLPGSSLAVEGAPSVRLTPGAWLPAIFGAFLALGALLVPAVRASRMSVVLYRRQSARGGGPPVWQRYYLDLFLLALAAFGYWEIRQQSAFAGSEGVDPLLLLSPALLALAVAAAFLRLFPLVLRSALRFVGRRAGPALLLSLVQMSRRPGPYARLVLLLTLTTSLGLFAATFSGTIDRSYHERTAYRVGADARIEGIAGGAGMPPAKIVDGLKFLSSSGGGLALGMRGNGSVGPAQANVRYDFLAIEPVVASGIGWFRDDFASRRIDELLNMLQPEAANAEGPMVPDGGELLGLWVRPTPVQPRLELLVRLRDADGRLLDLSLGRLDFNDWRLLEAPIANFGQYRAPLRLSAVYMTQAGGLAEAGGGSVLLDDLGIRERGGIRRIVESFDTIGVWEILRDAAGDQNDRLDLDRTATRSGTPGARFAWSPRRTFGTRGIRLRGEDSPLPVLASPGFLAASRRAVGDTLNLNIGDRTVSAVIQGTVDLFPTLDPAGPGFVVAALDPAMSRLNSVPGRPLYPNEAWLRLPEGYDGGALGATALGTLGARTVLDRRTLLRSASSDPLVAAGWSGILALAFLAASLLSLVGFLVQSYLMLQRRLVEFAIFRTMGLSFKQLLGLIAFEQALMILSGLAVGTVLGIQLGSLMLPLIELTERGGRVLPPFIITTAWQSVLPAYLVLGLVFGGAVAATGFILSHLAIGRVLRIGD